MGIAHDDGGNVPESVGGAHPAAERFNSREKAQKTQKELGVTRLARPLKRMYLRDLRPIGFAKKRPPG